MKLYIINHKKALYFVVAASLDRAKLLLPLSVKERSKAFLIKVFILARGTELTERCAHVFEGE